MPKQSQNLKTRVMEAAETALSSRNYVSVIDLFCGMRLLRSAHVDLWRKGQIQVLEEMIQAGPSKISSSIKIFQEWAQGKGLKQTETQYLCQGRSEVRSLQFSRSGDPELERLYRTHYISAEISERKQEQLQKRLNSAPPPVVFKILNDSECSECGLDLPKGSLLFKEAEQVLCLACAGFEELEFLPSGDTSLTRRATKYSKLAPVVVRFNRARKRYERQGTLVEVEALEKAERECVQDADERAISRARAAEQRRKQDQELVIRMKREIRGLFPGCPEDEIAVIAEHTAVRGSGRVGRSEAGRALEEHALTAAVIASIRHRHTSYDALLANGMARAAARQHIADKIDKVLEDWRK